MGTTPALTTLAVSLTHDAARSFAGDLHTIANNDEYYDEACDIGIGVTFRDETPGALHNMIRAIAEISVK